MIDIQVKVNNDKKTLRGFIVNQNSKRNKRVKCDKIGNYGFDEIIINTKNELRSTITEDKKKGIKIINVFKEKGNIYKQIIINKIENEIAINWINNQGLIYKIKEILVEKATSKIYITTNYMDGQEFIEKTISVLIDKIANKMIKQDVDSTGRLLKQTTKILR